MVWCVATDSSAVSGLETSKVAALRQLLLLVRHGAGPSHSRHCVCARSALHAGGSTRRRCRCRRWRVLVVTTLTAGCEHQTTISFWIFCPAFLLYSLLQPSTFCMCSFFLSSNLISSSFIPPLLCLFMPLTHGLLPVLPFAACRNMSMAASATLQRCLQCGFHNTRPAGVIPPLSSAVEMAIPVSDRHDSTTRVERLPPSSMLCDLRCIVCHFPLAQPHAMSRVRLTSL